MNKQEWNKKKYQENRDTWLKRSRTWAKNNPDKVREIQKRHRAKSVHKRLLDRAKLRARNMVIDFDLTLEDIVIPHYCPYLNITLDHRSKGHEPSLDRINSKKGYVKGNIMVVSTLANRMKNVATGQQLITFAKNVLKMKDIMEFS